jgi:hypothetical protein
VVTVRERRIATADASEAAEMAATATEQTRLEDLASENQAELDLISDETENLHDTVRARIEKEMGVFGV